MIAESFQESLALRELVAQKFQEADGDIKDLKEALNLRLNSIDNKMETRAKAMKLVNDSSIEKLSRQIQELSTRHSKQISTINVTLTKHLTEKTKVADDVDKIEQTLYEFGSQLSAIQRKLEIV